MSNKAIATAIAIARPGPTKFPPDRPPLPLKSGLVIRKIKLPTAVLVEYMYLPAAEAAARVAAYAPVLETLKQRLAALTAVGPGLGDIPTTAAAAVTAAVAATAAAMLDPSTATATPLPTLTHAQPGSSPEFVHHLPPEEQLQSWIRTARTTLEQQPIHLPFLAAHCFQLGTDKKVAEGVHWYNKWVKAQLEELDGCERRRQRPPAPPPPPPVPSPSSPSSSWLGRDVGPDEERLAREYAEKAWKEFADYHRVLTAFWANTEKKFRVVAGDLHEVGVRWICGWTGMPLARVGKEEEPKEEESKKEEDSKKEEEPNKEDKSNKKRTKEKMESEEPNKKPRKA